MESHKQFLTTAKLFYKNITSIDLIDFSDTCHHTPIHNRQSVALVSFLHHNVTRLLYYCVWLQTPKKQAKLCGPL